MNIISLTKFMKYPMKISWKLYSYFEKKHAYNSVRTWYNKVELLHTCVPVFIQEHLLISPKEMSPLFHISFINILHIHPNKELQEWPLAV